MLAHPHTKYRPFTPVDLDSRQWPSRTITQAPIWLSTDLRDGNQALFEPMNRERKLRLFEELVRLGFKEIEVGFPPASRTDFEVVRELVEQQRIPADVTPMVMTQLREDLIRETVRSVQGARRVIVHLYNAIAPVWRRVVFGLSVDEVEALVERHVRLLRELTDQHPETEWVLQYSPETFCMAELEVSLRMCNTAIRTWDAGPGRPIIINLPTTVEVATANVFADQIEWMHKRLERRDQVTLSVHPHNDRGTGVACAEQALLAGAQRVEGCLFGNGERSGNLDLVTLALNLYTQASAPGWTSPISRQWPGLPRNARRYRSIRAIPMSATWCSPPFPARTRTPSPRALPPRRPTVSGRYPTCPSIRRTWGGPTTASCGSTASPAKAGSLSCCSVTTASSCPGACRSSSAPLCRSWLMPVTPS